MLWGDCMSVYVSHSYCNTATLNLLPYWHVRNGLYKLECTDIEARNGLFSLERERVPKSENRKLGLCAQLRTQAFKKQKHAHHAT